MFMSDAEFGNMSLGFTWMIRLNQQQADRNLLLQSKNSPNHDGGAHFTTRHRTLHFTTAQQFTKTRRIQTSDYLPTDETEFFNSAVTALPANNTFKLFYDRNFCSLTLNATSNWGNKADSYRYFRMAYGLTGIVKFVTIADQLMTEEEIRKSFDLLMTMLKKSIFPEGSNKKTITVL
jgi:hypothetical protein